MFGCSDMSHLLGVAPVVRAVSTGYFALGEHRDHARDPGRSVSVWRLQRVPERGQGGSAAAEQPGEAVGAAGGELGGAHRLGRLGQRGRALVQPGADVVGRVRAALPFVAGQHGTTSGDTGEAGQSEQLPEAHGP